MVDDVCWFLACEDGKEDCDSVSKRFFMITLRKKKMVLVFNVDEKKSD
jgi:hypothetical protein